MKKLFLLLFSLPGVLAAQILPNLFSPFRLTDSKFRVDTVHFRQGTLQIEEYSFDDNENATLQSIYDWQTKDGWFIKSSRTFPNSSSYNYYESQFEYDSEGRPFQLHNFRRLKDQTFLEPSGKDSLVYEANLLRYDYRVTGNQNPGYYIEYVYDTVFGVKASYVRDIPADYVFGGMFEVTNFYKSGLPALVYGYSDATDKRTVGSARTFIYDNLDRVIESIDSSTVFEKLRFLGTQRIVYHENSTRIDSIINNQILYNEFNVHQLIYDASNKISQINIYRQTPTEPYRLVRRFDFINPSSSVLDQPETKIDLKLYPNPTMEAINIQSQEAILAVEVYQSNGVLVLQQQNIRGRSVDIRELVPGMYHVKIMTSKGAAYSNFVKLP